MKSRPILSSGEMVRAILNGTKTQTRRVCRDRELFDVGVFRAQAYVARRPVREKGVEIGRRETIVTCPFGQPGDRLWVRETYALLVGAGHRYVYSADGTPMQRFYHEPIANMKWRPSIHMPRRASRITLEITTVRIERLNDISEEDAKAEGIRELPGQEGEPGAWWTGNVRAGAAMHRKYPTQAFKVLWDSIYAKTNPWSSNPWVWVVEFKRVEGGAA